MQVVIVAERECYRACSLRAPLQQKASTAGSETLFTPWV